MHIPDGLFLFGGFLQNFVNGSIYSFGNQTLYVASYFQMIGVTQGSIATISRCYSIVAIVMAIFMFFGASFQNRLGHPTVGVVFGGGLGLSVVLSGLLMYTKTLWLFYISYSVLYALILSICFSNGLSAGVKRFTKNKGMVVGIMLCGNGSAQFVFGPIMGMLANPEGKSPDYAPLLDRPKELYFSAATGVPQRIPRSLIIMGLIYLVLAVIAGLLLQPAKTEPEKVPLTEGGDLEVAEKPAAPPKVSLGGVFNECVSDSHFWSLWALFTLNSIYFMFVGAMWKVVGIQTYHINDAWLARYGSMVMGIANSVMRPVWGRIIDAYGYKTTQFISNMGAAALYLLMWILPASLFEATPGLYLLWVGLVFACSSGNFTVLSASIARTYDNSKYAGAYGLLYTSRASGTALYEVVMVVVYLRMDMKVMVLFTAIVTAATTILLYFTRPGMKIKES